MRRRQDEDPEARREREFDIVTFVMAGLLGAIIVAAIGYGIFNSYRSRIPSVNAGWQIPGPPDRPSSTTGSR